MKEVMREEAHHGLADVISLFALVDIRIFFKDCS